jgi:Bacterial dnaA protein helix-turn-helix
MEQALAEYLEGKFYAFKDQDYSKVVDLNYKPPKPVAPVVTVAESRAFMMPPNILPFKTLTVMIKAVSVVTGVDVEAIQSKSRKAHVVKARHIFCYVCRRNIKKSLEEVGAKVNLNHSSVLNAIANMERDSEQHAVTIKAVEDLVAQWIKLP